MNPDGRPKTRSLEHNMVAIYRLIHQAMINQGSTNVAAACRAVMTKHASLRFMKPRVFSDGEEDDFLYDLCDNADNLRKRYYRALECSKDPEKYPDLHRTVKRLSRQLDGRTKAWKKLRADYDQQRQAGKLYNLPPLPSRKP